MKKYHIDELDHQIIDILIENARTPFTDIAKKHNVSAGTIHIRVNKMLEEGIIKGATLKLDYDKLGYSFIAYVGLHLIKSSRTDFVITELKKIPEITVAHLITGKFGVFCKVRAKSTKHAKDIIFKIDNIPDVQRTETSISLEESINDKNRLMHSIFEGL
ncbi:MAG: Lrp/AsnC ligand binding domain-containing protein [Flavobacteriales bacterium]|jgi:Lrp/AsnC family transcriptional regulator, regulator for asnA, asnC and gidA|nr:Lrp/AsnC ligand binding domain-containing protein [Flavobacteriales bacterium]